MKLKDAIEEVEEIAIHLQFIFRSLDLRKKREALRIVIEVAERCKELEQAAEMLWVTLAHVSGGDWTKQTKEWQEAVVRWRDNYFKVIKSDSPPDTALAPKQFETEEGGKE